MRARARASNPGYLASCPRCGGREITETKTGMIKRGGKLVGGTKSHVCVSCLSRGERVVIA